MDLATLGIRVDASGAVQTIGQVDAKLSGLQKTSNALTGALAKLGVTLGAGALFAKTIQETIESQNAMAQLEARVKSTGMAAGLTVQQLDAMSSALERQTIYSDEAVKGAQSLLLTFTKIKGETFKDATLAVANLATAMGTDLKGAALQVGKALQDPAQGLLALRRSGVSFSEAQQEVIKNLFATGREAEAQRLILKELEVEFGGAAEAARNTLGGALKGLGNAFGNLFEISREASGGIIGLINRLADGLGWLREKIVALVGGFRLMWVDLQVGIQKFNAKFYEGVALIADGAAKLLNLLPGTSDEVRDLEGAADALRLKAGILRDSMEAWRAEQQALITGTNQATTAIRAEAAATGELAGARTRAKAALPAGPGTQGGFAPVGGVDLAGSLTGARARVEAQITAGVKAEADKRAKIEIDAWLNANEERKAIYQNFLRGMQESFAKTFEGIFTKGIKSFGDLFSRLGDLIKQAAAQMAASGLMNFLSGKYREGGGGLGGIAAVASAIPGVGWIAGAVAGIAGLFSSHKKAAEAAKRQSEENRRLTIEHQKAADAAKVQAAAEAERSRVAQEWNVARAQDDLKVRDLKLKGLDDEAAAQELWNRQVAEFKAAVDEVNKGNLSEEYLKELGAIQQRERDALAAAQAANKAAEAERKLTEEREKAAAQAVAFQDLEVELLAAQGKTAEADQRAFELEQQRRLEDAQKNQTAEYVAKLKELQALQTANRAAALAGAGATAGGAEDVSTASNVFAGADTVTSSFGTRVSAEVGDRMLDNLISMRIILRSIEVNTRNIGGRINASLGLSLADNYALNGSAVVS